MSKIVGYTIVFLVVITVVGYVAPWAYDAVNDRIWRSENFLKEQVSDDYLYAQSAAEIQKNLEILREEAVETALLKQELRDDTLTISEIQQEIATQEGYLKTSHTWVKTHQATDTFSLAGRSYSYADVVADVNQRTNKCIELREKGASKQQLLNQRQQLVQEREAAIQKNYNELLKERDQLTLTYEKMKTSQQYLALEEEFSKINAQLTLDTRYQDELNKRAAKLQAEADLVAQEKHGSVLPYETSRTSSAQDPAVDFEALSTTQADAYVASFIANATK